MCASSQNILHSDCFRFFSGFSDFKTALLAYFFNFGETQWRLVDMQYDHSDLDRKANPKLKKLFLLVSVLAFSTSFAQYSLKKHSVNSGASKISGGRFEMQSSISQTDASVKQTGNNYVLTSGFWHGNNDLIFKNSVE